jgi:hypothetical protein
MAHTHIEIAHRMLVLWSDGSRISVPLAHVVGATANPQALAAWAGRLRREEPPAMLSGALAAHAARTREGDWAYWEARDLSRAVAIHLAGERVARLVVEVEDPRATAEAIAAALRGDAAGARVGVAA